LNAFIAIPSSQLIATSSECILQATVMELAYWKLVYYVTLSGQSHPHLSHFFGTDETGTFFTRRTFFSEEMKLYHSMNANNVLLKGVFPFIALMLFVGC